MKPFLHFDEISTEMPTYGTPFVVEAYAEENLLYFIQQPVTVRIQQYCSSYNFNIIRLTLNVEVFSTNFYLSMNDIVWIYLY